MRRNLMVGLALLLPLLVASCAGSQVSPAAPQATLKSPPAPGTVTVPSWQKRWDDTLATARKEGKVVVYGEVNPETRASLSAFEKKYNLAVEYVIGKSAEMATKWENERKAGLNLADAFIMGGGSSILSMKPKGAYSPMEPYFILPEVTDSKAWPGGKVPFLDKDKMVVPLNGAYTSYVTVNIDLIKPGELKSYRDLLRPEYKGRITLYDATITGGGAGWVTFLITEVYGMEKTREYLRQFAGMEPAITKDVRQQVEWLARGKYAIGIGAFNPLISEFRGQGAPLNMLHFEEGGNINPMSGAFQVAASPPHPNAAAIYVNWMLTAEGQKAFMEGYKSVPVRLDVPPLGVDPINIAQPGEKAFFTDEKFYFTQGEAQKLAREAFQVQK